MERTHLRGGAVAGLLAGTAMLLFLVAFRLVLGAPSLLELAADWFTTVLPPRAFAFLLDRLLTSAKPLLYVGQVMVVLGLAAGVGALYAHAGARWPRLVRAAWPSGLALGAGVFLLVGLGLAPLMGAGGFGAQAQGGAEPFVVATLVYSLVFGLTLAHLHRRTVEGPLPGDPSLAEGRRAFLRRAALWAAGLGVVGGGSRLVLEAMRRSTPSHYAFRPGAMPPAVTPNADVYTVSKNILDPEVDPTTWRLKVDGLVAQPLSLALEELRGMEAVEEYVTLECISNPVGGGLISNARWRGVPLVRLLERAGVREGVQRLVFHATDGYTDTLPLEEARREVVLVAYEMNGEPLPREHGAPARLLVPGRFGLKSVKWLTRVEATDQREVRGYWQTRGWDDEAQVLTMSRIDVPAPRARLPLGAALVGGVAYSGDRGVRRVEVSTDGGRTWTPAALEPALSPYTWVLWTAEWGPPAPGGYRLLVRATDGTGAPQVAEVRDTYPAGATGLHRVEVTVQ